MRVKGLPKIDEEENNPILRRTGHLIREEISDTTCVGLNICAENIFAHAREHICQHLCGARGTEILWCHGHK